MNKSLVVAALLFGGMVAHLQAEDKPDFSVLARRYRINVYNTFREDRPEYDRRQLLGRMAEWLYSQSNGDLQKQSELLSWVEQASWAITNQTTAPPLPGQAGYDTLEQYAAAIGYDEKAVAWIRNPANPTFAGFPERRTVSTNRPAVNLDTPSPKTPVASTNLSAPASATATSTSTAPPRTRRPSVLSRVLGAVTGPDEDETTTTEAPADPLPPAPSDAGDNQDTITTEPETAATGSGSDAQSDDLTSATTVDTDERDALDLSESATDVLAEGNDADLAVDTSAANQTTTLADHQEVLELLQEQLSDSTSSLDVKSLDVRTSLVENWFVEHANLERELTSAEDQATLTTLRTDAVAATQQLKDIAAETLATAEQANDPSAAHQAELKELRRIIGRLDDVVKSAQAVL